MLSAAAVALPNIPVPLFVGALDGSRTPHDWNCELVLSYEGQVAADGVFGSLYWDYAGQEKSGSRT